MNYPKIKHLYVLIISCVWLVLGCGDKHKSLNSGNEQYHIAPTGFDIGEEIEHDTLGSIQAALNAIAQKKHSEGDTVVLTLLGGIHRLNEPISLNPQLYQNGRFVLKIEAAAGAKPVLSGAVNINNWELHDPEKNIYRAKLEANHYRSRQLYVNGKRGIRARTKEYPRGYKPTYSTDPQENGIQYKFAELFHPDDNPANWSHPDRIQAVMKFQWKMISIPVKSITPARSILDRGLIFMKDYAWKNANLYNGFGSEKPGVWSFWRVSYFENCYEFLDEEGEWYLNETTDVLYYKPRKEEDMLRAHVELPVLETLIEGFGTQQQQLQDIIFDKIGFEYATWMTPDSEIGYVSDQSGCYVVGENNKPNTTGHVENVKRTAGNLQFRYAQNITFSNCQFQHLGGVALDFGLGSKYNTVDGNTFIDISSAAIQLGGVSKEFHHPKKDIKDLVLLEHNTITNNTISYTAQEYVDAAAIFAGFTAHTNISHNDISHTNWAGVAMGWGWGLLDTSGYPGLMGASWHAWGKFDEPTPNNNNKITYNRISHFIENRWDGGMIYTTGQLGHDWSGALLIKGNVGHDKRPLGGGNAIYTDGGSRYVKVIRNASYNNPIGIIDLGEPIIPIPLEALPEFWKISDYTLLNLPYGGDCGGCRTYGDIIWEDNYWNEGGIPIKEWFSNKEVDVAKYFIHHANGINVDSLNLYSKNGFFNICPFWDDSTKLHYPTDTTFNNNHTILDMAEIPVLLLDSAGVQTSY